MMLDGEIYGQLTPDKIKEIIDKIVAEEGE